MTVRPYCFKTFTQTSSSDNMFLCSLTMKFLDLHTVDQQHLEAGPEDPDVIKSYRI